MKRTVILLSLSLMLLSCSKEENAKIASGNFDLNLKAELPEMKLVENMEIIFRILATFQNILLKNQLTNSIGSKSGIKVESLTEIKLLKQYLIHVLRQKVILMERIFLN